MIGSASSLARTFACPGSARLPTTDYKTVDAEEGNERHASLEERAKRGDLPYAIRELCPEATRFMVEAKFAYDLATGVARHIEHPGHRNYGTLGPFEIPMQADLLMFAHDRVVVVDYKNRERVEPAATNRQLACIAMTVASWEGVADATVALAYPKHETDDDFFIDKADLSVMDFDAYRTELMDLHQLVAKGGPLNEGPWCKYCPSFMHCPKKAQTVLEVSSGAADNRVEMILPLGSDEGAQQAYEFAQKLRLLLKRIDAAIYARANERPIPLAGGKMFGPREKLGNEKLDGDTVYDVVKQFYGQGVADAVVMRSATKTRLKEALGFAGVGSVAAAERKVLDEVRSRGGTKRELKIEIGEYMPERQLKAVNE